MHRRMTKWRVLSPSAQLTIEPASGARAIIRDDWPAPSNPINHIGGKHYRRDGVRRAATCLPGRASIFRGATAGSMMAPVKQCNV
jgi:hypothetical protein